MPEVYINFLSFCCSTDTRPTFHGNTVLLTPSTMATLQCWCHPPWQHHNADAILHGNTGFFLLQAKFPLPPVMPGATISVISKRTGSLEVDRHHQSALDIERLLMWPRHSSGHFYHHWLILLASVSVSMSMSYLHPTSQEVTWGRWWASGGQVVMLL